MREKYLRKIEFVFYNEGEIRQVLLEERQRRIQPEIHNASGLSDPTAAEAIKNITPINSIKVLDKILMYPEKWLEVVEKTYQWARNQGEVLYEIARRRYRGEHHGKICTTLGISVDNFYRQLERVRFRAALEAAYRRLIQL